MNARHEPPGPAGGRRPGHAVVVVGAGWAGLAAALAARDAHAEVVVIDGGVGASSLGSGAFDDVPWDERERAASVLGAPLVARPDAVAGGVASGLAWITRRLGSRYLVPAPGDPLPVVASTSGRLRSAAAIDVALLDLARLPASTRVLVPEIDRPGWDARTLAWMFADEPVARRRELTFVPVRADVLRYDDERRIPDADLASRHDAPARRDWLATQLRDALARAGDGPKAILVGSWLGVTAPCSAELSAAIGAPVGEALVANAATPGLRFEAATAAAFRREGVRVVRDRAMRVERAAGRVVVHTKRGEVLEADGVVLAIGGLAGGGIVFEPPEHGAGAEGADVIRAPFRLSVDVGARIEVRGESGVGSSAFGPALDDAAWPSGGAPGAIETVGVRAAEDGDGLFFAGDVVAGRARTVGEAVGSGRSAGTRAARG